MKKLQTRHERFLKKAGEVRRTAEARFRCGDRPGAGRHTAGRPGSATLSTGAPASTSPRK